MIDLPPPGFRGLDPDRPVRIYRRHLPHWRQDGATYFVTFRLADSLPRARLDELEEEKKRWEQRHPDPTDLEQAERWRRQMEKIEEWLDQGHGSCVLQYPEAAVIAETALHHFDEQCYAQGERARRATLPSGPTMKVRCYEDDMDQDAWSLDGHGR